MLCMTIRDGAAFYVGDAKIYVDRDGNRTRVRVDAAPQTKILRAELYEAEPRREDRK